MRNARWLLLALGIAALVVLFILLRPRDDDPTATPSPSPSPTFTSTPEDGPSPTPDDRPDAPEIEVEIEDGAITVEVEGDRMSGPTRVRVTQGNRVDLKVEGDVMDEVHLHGYDLFAELRPGREARMRFRADIPGVFEMELEAAGTKLLDLEVRP